MHIHMKRFLVFVLLTSLIFCCGCSKKEEVSLTLWVQKEEYNMVSDAVEQFMKDNAQEVNLV